LERFCIFPEEFLLILILLPGQRVELLIYVQVVPGRYKPHWENLAAKNTLLI
jgi:hypothetical protein